MVYHRRGAIVDKAVGSARVRRGYGPRHRAHLAPGLQREVRRREGAGGQPSLDNEQKARKACDDAVAPHEIGGQGRLVVGVLRDDGAARVQDFLEQGKPALRIDLVDPSPEDDDGGRPVHERRLVRRLVAAQRAPRDNRRVALRGLTGEQLRARDAVGGRLARPDNRHARAAQKLWIADAIQALGWLRHVFQHFRIKRRSALHRKALPPQNAPGASYPPCHTPRRPPCRPRERLLRHLPHLPRILCVSPRCFPRGRRRPRRGVPRPLARSRLGPRWCARPAARG